MAYLDTLTDSQLLRSILASLRRLEALAAPLEPPPLQHYDHLPTPPPDLSPLVATLAAMPAAPSADEIARALVSELAPFAPGGAGGLEVDRYEASARALQEALDKIDFRLQGLTAGTGYIGGSVSLSPGQTVSLTTPMETGLAKDATLLRRYGTHTTKAGLANTTGDNTLHTPATGKKIRLYWLALSTSQDNAAENLVRVKFGAAGSDVYRWRMGNPGAFSGSRTVEGAVDTALILNLANVQPVDWNVDLEEVI
jgi:hypothetical protein